MRYSPAAVIANLCGRPKMTTIVLTTIALILASAGKVVIGNDQLRSGSTTTGSTIISPVVVALGSPAVSHLGARSSIC